MVIFKDNVNKKLYFLDIDNINSIFSVMEYNQNSAVPVFNTINDMLLKRITYTIFDLILDLW